MTDISFTKIDLPYGWLGNMSRFKIWLPTEDQMYPTSEHLFQALRFPDGHQAREAIRKMSSPMSAKMKAKELRSEMTVLPRGAADVANMSLVLTLKLEQHPHLKEMLMETGDARIIEDVTARPRSESNMFWGMVKNGSSWHGENQLGKLWMELRR